MKKTSFILLIYLFTALFVSCYTKKSIPENPHFLPMEKAYNVRDLGGYKTADGRQVKRNKIFRSGSLNHLSDNDLKYFNAIPIKTYIDFRDEKERRKAPDRKPASVVNQFFFPIETGSIASFRDLKPEKTPTLLIEGNKIFVRENQEQYRGFFDILMQENYAPLLFHCSAGKDRAGFAAALFLASLSVDREIIIEDYMLSNEGLEGKYTTLTNLFPRLEPLLVAKREYIQAAFDVIDQEYGGMKSYLINNLNVDIEKMRDLYTEEVPETGKTVKP